jgi:hypothetical protein
MVRAGLLPPGTIVGRWWKDEIAEIDVFALDDKGPVLVGECRWQRRPMSERDLAELRRKTALAAGREAVPPGATYAFWSRGGNGPSLDRHADVRGFTPHDILTPL